MDVFCYKTSGRLQCEKDIFPVLWELKKAGKGSAHSYSYSIWYLQYMSFRDRTSKCDIEDIHSAYQQPRGCYVDTKAKWTAWGCPVTAAWRIFSLGTWTAVEHNFMLLLFCYSFIKFNLLLWVLGNKPQWIVWYIWSATISTVVFIYFLLEFISQLVFVCILSFLCSIKRCSLESNCNLYKLANNIKE